MSIEDIGDWGVLPSSKKYRGIFYKEFILSSVSEGCGRNWTYRPHQEALFYLLNLCETDFLPTRETKQGA